MAFCEGDDCLLLQYANIKFCSVLFFFLSLYGVYRSKKVQPCLLKGELLFSDAVAAYIPQSQYKTNNQMHTIANLLMI